MEDILKHGDALNMWREIVGDWSAWQRFTSDIFDKIERDRRRSNMEKRVKYLEMSRK